MFRMVAYSRRLQSGQITCYLNRTYHVLTTVVSGRSPRRRLRDNVVENLFGGITSGLPVNREQSLISQKPTCTETSLY